MSGVPKSLACAHRDCWQRERGIVSGLRPVLAENYLDEPEIGVECPATADLRAATGDWTVEADGDMTGEYDPEGDRMFNGDTLNCRGWRTYRNAGREGLVFVEACGTGGADDN